MTSAELAAIPARVAYTADDGTPRIVASWFQWTDGELVMPTFIRAPHVAAASRRLTALRSRPDVAVSIDTGSTPAQALLVRGLAQVAEVVGIDLDYARSARQYLGHEAARLLAMADQPGTYHRPADAGRPSRPDEKSGCAEQQPAVPRTDPEPLGGDKQCTCWGPERHRGGAEATELEHQRRMVSLRADGVIAILCPVASETLAGVAIMTVPPEEAREIMGGDPCVRARMILCEVHSCHSFPGDALPA